MLNEQFLLHSQTAKTLYESVRNLPIIDYHNHLSVTDIAQDRRFLDIYELWIQPDPYKHRAMRMCGVAEKYITGDASKEEKFAKWCETLPKLQLNPLSHWSMMELELFGITECPTSQNAMKLYEACNAYLASHEVTANSLLKSFGVEYACPCASLVDDTACFEGISFAAPSLRGDDAVAPTAAFLQKLSVAAGMEITDIASFERAIEKRLLAMKKAGCVFADHALDDGFIYYVDDGENEGRFQALLQGELTDGEMKKLSSYILFTLSKLYAKHSFVLQLHIGAQRFTSTRLRQKAGAAGGFAGIGGGVCVYSLTKFLDEVDCSTYGLPKTVLFTLNPADNAVMSVLSGSYAKDGVKGLVTQGPAWWWCDHKQGMIEMLENASVFGVLSNFIGMTTDSRSFLSFVRHDYFRRVFCDWLGEKWEQGEVLCDMDGLKTLAKSLCYDNAKKSVNRN